MPWTNQGGGGGGPWGSGGKGPWGSGPQSPGGPKPPDLEEILRRGQDKLRRLLPGGNMGGKGFALLGLAAIALWGFSGFFKVEPDELGVVLRFGQEVREVQPGLNYHLPYPIETALTPKALRINKIDIGVREVDPSRRGGAGMRDVPEESLMLTGDENIVDVDFSVLWKVKPTGVGQYLFNIQNPEGTVKAVAESAMREVVGRSEIQPILTGARQTIETRGAGPDAEDARPLRRRHRRDAGAVAEGRSADAGDRRLPRRAGRARRPRALGQRGADLCQQGDPAGDAAMSPRSCRRRKPTGSRPSPRRPARPRAS